MATFIKTKIKKDTVIYNTSDWHVGSKAFHEDGAQALVQKVKDDDAYLTFGGDCLEGKPVRSKHFDPAGLTRDEINIEAQVQKFCNIMRPIADRILLIQTGNHELYLLKDMDVIKLICGNLGIPHAYGQYQSWVKVSKCTLHFWHGRPTMPRGAKDPIQREANQKAWLKNKMAPLAGSADAQYMAHTHQCMIVPPIEKCMLLDSGDNVHQEVFIEGAYKINGKKFMPPDARWYVNTGTLRRGGGFDYQDYSEIAGYNPPAIACTKTTLANKKVQNIEKILL